MLVTPGAIPRSGIGKVRYLDLRQQVADGRLASVTLHIK